MLLQSRNVRLYTMQCIQFLRIVLLWSRDLWLYIFQDIQFSLNRSALVQRCETVHYTVITVFPVYCCSGPEMWDCTLYSVYSFSLIALHWLRDFRLYTVVLLWYYYARETWDCTLYTVYSFQCAVLLHSRDVRLSALEVQSQREGRVEYSRAE